MSDEYYGEEDSPTHDPDILGSNTHADPDRASGGIVSALSGCVGATFLPVAAICAWNGYPKIAIGSAAISASGIGLMCRLAFNIFKNHSARVRAEAEQARIETTLVVDEDNASFEGLMRRVNDMWHRRPSQGNMRPNSPTTPPPP